MSVQWNLIFLLYLKLFVSCARSSLTLVVDDSASMLNEIDQIRQTSAEIMNIVKSQKSEIEDVVLVTFNDPDVVLRTKTSNPDTLIQALRNITLVGGGDCPEYALSGIEKALEESGPSSYLYVFTDASAKDYNKVNSVISLCQRKQSQVVFILTGDCGDTQSDKYTVYQKIASACSGQVFKVLKEEVTDVLETVKEVIQCRRTVIKSQIVPVSATWHPVSVLGTVKAVVEGQKPVVTSQLLPASATWHPVSFTVDDLLDHVLVSASASNVDLIINDSPTSPETKMSVVEVMWKPSGKVVEFVAPKPGTYYAWVKADTDISIIVNGRTK